MILEKLGQLITGAEVLVTATAVVSGNVIDLRQAGYIAGTDGAYAGPSGAAGDLPWIEVLTKGLCANAGQTDTLKVALVASHNADLTAGYELCSVTIADLRAVLGDPRVAAVNRRILRCSLPMELASLIDKLKGSNATDIRYLGFLITATNVAGGGKVATDITLLGVISPSKPTQNLMPPIRSNVGIPS